MKHIVKPEHDTCALALMAAGMSLLPLTGNATLSGARVLADEIITTTTQTHNGSNPMWCLGAPLIVRENGNVWASISVHDPDEPPMCNAHWELWRKTAPRPWAQIRRGPAASEREPCPLFMPEPGRLMLSVHPKILEKELQSDGEYSWYCQPAIAAFDTRDIHDEVDILQPEFPRGTQFTQHSYRSLAVDSASRAFLLMVINRENDFNVTWRDASGTWRAVGAPAFPIRSCYATMLLNGTEGHVFAIGDIKEPVQAWKEEKFRVLNREWDYAFRRVFYARAPDLGTGKFDMPLEIDTVDDTAGWAFNLDMAIDANGRVHLLWVRQNIHYDFLRDRFFPGVPILQEIRHAVIENGRVISTETLSSQREAGDAKRRRLSTGRFHQLPDGRLLAVLFAERANFDEPSSTELRIQEMDLMARNSAPPVRVHLEKPLSAGWFFTNTTRGGSKPDNNLDILTTETRDGIISLRYIHVLIP